MSGSGDSRYCSLSQIPLLTTLRPTLHVLEANRGIFLFSDRILVMADLFLSSPQGEPDVYPYSSSERTLSLLQHSPSTCSLLRNSFSLLPSLGFHLVDTTTVFRASHYSWSTPAIIKMPSGFQLTQVPNLTDYVAIVTGGMPWFPRHDF